jgi:hypothetical protein
MSSQEMSVRGMSAGDMSARDREKYIQQLSAQIEEWNHELVELESRQRAPDEPDQRQIS